MVKKIRVLNEGVNVVTAKTQQDNKPAKHFNGTHREVLVSQRATMRTTAQVGRIQVVMMMQKNVRLSKQLVASCYRNITLELLTMLSNNGTLLITVRT